MATSTDLKQRAQTLAAKTDINSIDPQEVGGLFYDMAGYAEDVQRNGGSLGIRKVYASVSAMEADSTSPKDMWGNPMRKGQLCVIYDGTTEGADNNKIFAFKAPGWEIATQLDAGYATRGELTELEQSFLSDRSISGRPSIHLNHVCNFITDGGFTEYIESEEYDSAWILINHGEYLKVDGVMPSRISFFNTDTPVKEGFLKMATGLTGYISIPEGSLLAILTLKKSDNPGGYANLSVKQDNRFICENDYLRNFVSRNNILGSLSSLNAISISKNLLNTKDVLENYRGVL